MDLLEIELIKASEGEAHLKIKWASSLRGNNSSTTVVILTKAAPDGPAVVDYTKALLRVNPEDLKTALALEASGVTINP